MGGAKKVGRRSGKLGIRCSDEWAAWLLGLSRYVDVGVCDVVAQAVRRYGESVAYPVAPPNRLPRSDDYRPTLQVREQFNEQAHPGWD